MRLVVTCEARFSLAPDGSVWTQTSFDYDFWRRYLTAFEKVRIVARACHDPHLAAGYKRVTGPQVELFPIPFYLGPREFVQKRSSIRSALKASVGNQDALLCRVSSPIAGDLLAQLDGSGRPYGLEILGDPDEGLGPGTVRHPLRPLFRWMAIRALHRQCSNAAGIAYVTRETLQRKYPGNEAAFTTHYSSLACTDEDFVDAPRLFGPEVTRAPRLIFVGSLAQMYKGPDVLIKALQKLAPKIDLSLTMIGDGKHRSELEQLGRTLGVSGLIHFAGALPSGRAIREQLDQADLLVMPSRTEGLPRAMIEAMARALPCIGSRVGGIPELLIDDDMAPAGNVDALADKILAVVSDTSRLQAMSRRNLQAAQEYRPALLAKRRNQFYDFLRRTTQNWIASTSPRHPAAETMRHSEISA